MSKFFLTNSNKYYQKAIETIKLSDFLLSFSKQINGVYACATKKLLIEHQNSVDIGDDFVMTNGTLLYKENNSTATWELIYDDYSYDIEKMRNQSCGNYAVCIKKGDNIDVWGEEFGGYDIYYYYDNGCYMVSNSLYDLAKTLRDKISVNKLNLVEEAANNTILCGETFFNEIKRLSGSQYIHIELKTNKFEVHDLPISYPIQKESVEDCAIKVADTLKNKAHCIYQALGNPAINMTGGLDARISLASYLSVGAKPFLNYGVGNSGLTNTKNEDLKIDLEFRNRYGLDLRIGSWKTSPIIDKYWNYYCSKYGFYSCVYTASKDVMEYFERCDNLLLDMTKDSLITSFQAMEEDVSSFSRGHLLMSDVRSYNLLFSSDGLAHLVDYDMFQLHLRANPDSLKLYNSDTLSSFVRSAFGKEVSDEITFTDDERTQIYGILDENFPVYIPFLPSESIADMLEDGETPRQFFKKRVK